MKRSLVHYRASYPGKVVFDLGQSVKDKRGRVDLKHGELPTLATSSRYLWSHGLISNAQMESQHRIPHEQSFLNSNQLFSGLKS